MGCFYTSLLLLCWLSINASATSAYSQNGDRDSLVPEFGRRYRKPVGDTNEDDSLRNSTVSNGAGAVLAQTGVLQSTESAKDRTSRLVKSHTNSTSSPRSTQGTTNSIVAKEVIRNVGSHAATNAQQKRRTVLQQMSHYGNKNTSTKKDEPSSHGNQNLIQLPDLQLNRIEPFWPFSNVSSTFLLNNLKVIKDENTEFFHDNMPNRFKDTTFFFSHIGPNSFEYRAQFHHNQNKFQQPKDFKPFVHEYPQFPKITFPPFPAFPQVPDVYHHHKPQFRSIPEFNQFQFPKLLPPVKQVSRPTLDDRHNGRLPESTNDFEEPFKRYDVVLGEISTKYPKIFRFNDERINIEDFEKQKKLQAKLGAHNHNGISEPENVQRNHLLILHGGIFTVKEPPLYHRKVIRKRRGRIRNTRVTSY